MSTTEVEYTHNNPMSTKEVKYNTAFAPALVLCEASFHLAFCLPIYTLTGGTSKVHVRRFNQDHSTEPFAILPAIPSLPQAPQSGSAFVSSWLTYSNTILFSHPISSLSLGSSLILCTSVPHGCPFWPGVESLKHCVNQEKFCNFPKPQIPDLEIRLPLLLVIVRIKEKVN